MPRFTGAVKHTLGPLEGDTGPAGRSPNEETIEQTRQRATLVQNMLLKPEPKADTGNRLSDRSGEPSSSSSKEDGTDNAKVQAPEPSPPQEKAGGESKETGGEREMLMEAQPLKGKFHKIP